MSKKSNSNDAFFHMLSLIIERAISKNYITSNCKLIINADKRSNTTIQKDKLKTNVGYLSDIEIEEINFVDSHLNTTIQVADIVSFKCFNMIRNAINNNELRINIPGLSIRNIYY
jgi:hypothetical protein